MGNVFSKKQRYAAVGASVAVSLLMVAGAVFGATTISTNIVTGGNLTVSGTVSFTNALTVANGGTGLAAVAAGDILYANTPTSLARIASTTNGYTLALANGIPTWVATSANVAVGTTNTYSALQSFQAGISATNVNASGASTFATSTGSVGIGTTTPGKTFAVQGDALVSGTLTVGILSATNTLAVASTLSVTSLSTFTGGFISSASSSANTLNLAGNLSASSTAQFAGLTTHTLGIVSQASSSISSSLEVMSLGVATSSTAQEVNVGGSGTTTIRLLSSSATRGGCIELQDEYGTAYKLQVSSSTASYGNGLATTTAGQSGFLAVWEPGHCK